MFLAHSFFEQEARPRPCSKSRRAVRKFVMLMAPGRSSCGSNLLYSALERDLPNEQSPYVAFLPESRKGSADATRISSNDTGRGFGGDRSARVTLPPFTSPLIQCLQRMRRNQRGCCVGDFEMGLGMLGLVGE
jgi:hypothetical protein